MWFIAVVEQLIVAAAWYFSLIYCKIMFISHQNDKSVVKIVVWTRDFGIFTYYNPIKHLRLLVLIGLLDDLWFRNLHITRKSKSHGRTITYCDIVAFTMRFLLRHLIVFYSGMAFTWTVATTHMYTTWNGYTSSIVRDNFEFMLDKNISPTLSRPIETTRTHRPTLP